MYNSIFKLLAKQFPKTEEEILKEVWSDLVDNGKQPNIYIKYKKTEGLFKEQVEHLKPKNIKFHGDLYARHKFYFYSVSALVEMLKEKGYKLVFEEICDDNYQSKTMCSYKSHIVENDYVSETNRPLILREEIHCF